MAETGTLITAEQLAEIAGDRRAELVRGELVEMAPVGGTHCRLVARLLAWIEPFVTQRKLGAVGPEWGFILARNPDVVRAPDVAFVSADRLRGADMTGFFPGAPDLVIEVLSPNDRAGEVQEKIREYLAAGTRLILVADPRSQTVTAYHSSGDAHIYSGSQEVSGADVLAGFSFRPADLFHLD